MVKKSVMRPRLAIIINTQAHSTHVLISCVQILRNIMFPASPRDFLREPVNLLIETFISKDVFHIQFTPLSSAGGGAARLRARLTQEFIRTRGSSSGRAQSKWKQY